MPLALVAQVSKSLATLLFWFDWSSKKGVMAFSLKSTILELFFLSCLTSALIWALRQMYLLRCRQFSQYLEGLDLGLGVWNICRMETSVICRSSVSWNGGVSTQRGRTLHWSACLDVVAQGPNSSAR